MKTSPAELMDEAIQKGDTAKAKALLEDKAQPYAIDQIIACEATALHRAILWNKEPIVELLIFHGADPKLTNDEGNNCLHMACMNDELTHNIVQQLIPKVDLDEQNDYGNTALHLAASRADDCCDVIKLLVAAKAKLNVQNSYGETPLHLAVKKEHVKVVELLLKSGADPNLQDSCGNSAFHENFFYLYRHDLVTLFLEHGADVNLKDRYGRHSLHVLIDHGKSGVDKKLSEMTEMTDNLDEVENTMWSYKDFTCFKNCDSSLKFDVKLLLNHGAKVDAVDNKGRTALYKAVKTGHNKTAGALVYFGADVNASETRKPIIAAIKTSNLRMVKFLMANKADLKAKDVHGLDAMAAALKYVKDKDAFYYIVQMLMGNKVEF